jgi:hypothetical protein
MDHVLKRAIHALGFPGLKKLAYTLSGSHNNLQVSKDFGLKLFDVVCLSKNIDMLCHYILEAENEMVLDSCNLGRPDNVFDFVQRQVA